MKRFYQIALRAVLAGALLVVLGLAGMYWAIRSTPPQYAAAVAEQDPAKLDEDRRELESQLAIAYSDSQRSAPWAVCVSDDQLNAWLATQLPLDYPELAQRGLSEPRIIFTPQSAQLAFRAKFGSIDTVVSVTGNVFATETGELAIEFQNAAAGRAAIPLTFVVQGIDEGIRLRQLPFHWAPGESRHVLLVDFERLASSPEQARKLSAIEVREGEVYVAGVTTDRGEPEYSTAQRP
jgi:hypothetical protein